MPVPWRGKTKSFGNSLKSFRTTVSELEGWVSMKADEEICLLIDIRWCADGRERQAQRIPHVGVLPPRRACRGGVRSPCVSVVRLLPLAAGEVRANTRQKNGAFKSIEDLGRRARRCRSPINMPG